MLSKNANGRSILGQLYAVALSHRDVNDPTDDNFDSESGVLSRRRLDWSARERSGDRIGPGGTSGHCRLQFSRLR